MCTSVNALPRLVQCVAEQEAQEWGICHLSLPFEVFYALLSSGFSLQILKG